MRGKKTLSLILIAATALCGFSCGETTPEESGDPLDKYAEVPVAYERQQAEYEDAGINLWFDHSFSKTPKGETASTGRDTYKLYMAKNEIEDCQFFLTSSESKSVSLRVTDFTNGNGSVVPAKLYSEYYFAMPFDGDADAEVPDAIPPVKSGETFALGPNASCGFVLQAKSAETSPAGEYTATLDVLDEEGRQVKTATVFLKIWNFALSESTECRTAMWIDRNKLAGMSYEDIYDYLLDNRVNAYDLPYALSDSRVDAYLDHPRVNSFNILGFKFNKESGKSETQIKSAMRAAYEKLSPKQEWNKKGYFYLVDEPNPTEIYKLEWIREYGEWLEECYPGYRQLSPFFTDDYYDETRDWIEYMRPYINIWVPKTYAYTTLREYGNIPNARCLYKEGYESLLDKQFGNYPDRIEKMKKEDGAEAWWYVTSQPSDPYITLNTTEPGVAYRNLFWQQKMNNVKGFLYWSVNYWSGDGWNACESEWTQGTATYGNGQLIYPGAKVGQSTPVGSLRLEAIRDGIEDYQVLTMLEERIGTQAVKEFINRITTHVAVWEENEDTFAGERVRLGNYLEAVLAG